MDSRTDTRTSSAFSISTTKIRSDATDLTTSGTSPITETVAYFTKNANTRSTGEREFLVLPVKNTPKLLSFGNRASKRFHYGSESSSSISLFVRCFCEIGPSRKRRWRKRRGEMDLGMARSRSLSIRFVHRFQLVLYRTLGYYTVIRTYQTPRISKSRRNSSQDVLYSRRYSAILDFFYTGL